MQLRTTYLFLILLLLIGRQVTCYARDVETVINCRKHLAHYLDQEVVLHVVQLTRIEGTRGFVRYYADTAGVDGFGGTISVVVPTRSVLTKQDRELFALRLAEFERYFRLSPKAVARPDKNVPRIPLRGILVQQGTTLALLVDLYPTPLAQTEEL